jgi:hypothetical protein
MTNALSTIAALSCNVETDDSTKEGGVSSSMSFRELSHFHGYKDTLVDDRVEGFAELKDMSLITPLKDNDKFMRILSVIIGNSKIVDSNSYSDYTIKDTPALWTHYTSHDTPSTPRKQDALSHPTVKKEKTRLKVEKPPLPAPFVPAAGSDDSPAVKQEDLGIGTPTRLSNVSAFAALQRSRIEAKAEAASQAESVESDANLTSTPSKRSRKRDTSGGSPAAKRPRRSARTNKKDEGGNEGNLDNDLANILDSIASPLVKTTKSKTAAKNSVTAKSSVKTARKPPRSRSSTSSN